MRIKLAGAVSQFNTIKKMFPYLKSLQTKGYKIDVYDGTDLCKWNGGRVNTDIKLTLEILDFYNSNDIGVFLTFSNYKIDLTDETGNRLLKMLDNPLNGVIIMDESLRQYVKLNYPNLQVTYSFTGTAQTVNDYKELQDKYNFIVPRIELFFNDDFIKQIDLSKCELWLEEQCVNCKMITYHHNMIADLNSKYDNPYKEAGLNTCKKWSDCILHDKNLSNITDKRYFSKNTVQQLIDIGYTNFKITGREFAPERFEEIIKEMYRIFK